MNFKSSFRRDLVRLRSYIDRALLMDDNDKAELSHCMVPIIFQFSNLFWCKSFKDYLKK